MANTQQVVIGKLNCLVINRNSVSKLWSYKITSKKNPFEIFFFCLFSSEISESVNTTEKNMNDYYGNELSG